VLPGAGWLLRTRRYRVQSGGVTVLAGGRLVVVFRPSAGLAVPLHPEAAAFAEHYGFAIDVLAALFHHQHGSGDILGLPPRSGGAARSTGSHGCGQLGRDPGPGLGQEHLDSAGSCPESRNKRPAVHGSPCPSDRDRRATRTRSAPRTDQSTWAAIPPAAAGSAEPPARPRPGTYEPSASHSRTRAPISTNVAPASCRARR